MAVVGSLNEVLLGLLGGDDAGALVPQSVVSRDVKGRRGDGDGDGAAGGKGVVIAGISVPYCKWLIAPPGRRDGAGGTEGRGEREGQEAKEEEEEEEEEEKEEKEESLPPGSAFSEPRRDELGLVISRTEIPRSEETLALLGSVGIRYTPDPTSTSTSTLTPTPTSTSTTPSTNPTPNSPSPTQSDLIAWAFLGVDGSLTSLHVEPPHRGLGLAKAVSRRLFRLLADDAPAMGFGPVVAAVDGAGKEEEEDGGGGGEGWAHSDVAVGNVGSAGVARGLGGVEGWRVRWVGVDLRAVAGW